jgi:hypothetical protein
MLTCIILILTCINQVLRYFGSDSRTPIYNYYLMKLCLHLGENQNNFLCSFNHFFYLRRHKSQSAANFYREKKIEREASEGEKLKNLVFHDNHRSLRKQC